MTKILFIIAGLLPLTIIAQVNCNVFKYQKDEYCFKACEHANQGAELPQGSKASQQKFDQAIKLCPTMDYAFFEKSVPYLKNGQFIEWKKLIDQAVNLNPRAHLGYRGWCRYQFLRDYKGAIQDFEKLDSLSDYDIGYSINGDYHLQVARALCYKFSGDRKKAIDIIEQQLITKDYLPMNYDYLHLGVLKFETQDFDGATQWLTKAIAFNDYLAETYYFLALVYKQKGDLGEFMTYMEKAKIFYQKNYRRFDGYTHPADKIYLADIERELASVKKK